VSAYDGQTDQELMDLAKRIMAAWVKEPIGSIERSMKAAAHESVMGELHRRMARHINKELGLPDVDI
jgi:hypothetical protein